jgi:hypothetical protein
MNNIVEKREARAILYCDTVKFGTYVPTAHAGMILAKAKEVADCFAGSAFGAFGYADGPKEVAFFEWGRNNAPSEQTFSVTLCAARTLVDAYRVSGAQLREAADGDLLVHIFVEDRVGRTDYCLAVRGEGLRGYSFHGHGFGQFRSQAELASAPGTSVLLRPIDRSSLAQIRAKQRLKAADTCVIEPNTVGDSTLGGLH